VKEKQNKKNKKKGKHQEEEVKDPVE